MADLQFDWDPKKASSNEKKHGVMFDEAQTVFYDHDALVISDPDHSQGEDRLIILGLSSLDRAGGGALFSRGGLGHQNHFSKKSRNKRAEALLGEKIMRAEYDFTNAVKNPYPKKEKKAVTIRLETDVVDYFKGMSKETGIPYQNLINLYLRDCAEHSRKLSLVWNKKEK